MVILVFLCLTVAIVPQAVAGLLPGAMDQLFGAEAGQAFLAMRTLRGPARDAGLLERVDADRAGDGGGLAAGLISLVVTGRGPDMGLRIPRAERCACSTRDVLSRR